MGHSGLGIGVPAGDAFLRDRGEPTSHYVPLVVSPVDLILWESPLLPLQSLGADYKYVPL